MLLHELYPGPGSGTSGSSEIHLDVVLVHGLGGHYTETWQADDKTLWPRDLLPKSLHPINIRVLSFEYGGSIKSTSSKAGIDDTAQNLLQLLVDKRYGPREECRPIIFVGHSLGGIIIKRVIRAAYNDPAFKPIKNTTLGVMFFATPHRGSRKEFSYFLSNVLECNRPRVVAFPGKWIKPTSGMAKEIKQDPGLFTFISDDFIHLYSRLSSRAFQEGHKTKPLDGMVVGSDLGKLGIIAENDVTISGDHLSLCKFKRDQIGKDRFLVVWKGMERMISESPRQKKNIERRTKALNSLCSDELCQSMMTRKLINRTGKWIWDRTEFKDWLDHQSGKPGLWITGNPGCGKSYLAKHIVDKLNEQGKSVICAFLCEPDPTSIDAQRLFSEIVEQAIGIEPRLRNHRSSAEGSGVRDLLIDVLNRVAMGSRPIRQSHPSENNLQGILAATTRQLLEMTPELIDSILIRDWKANKQSSSWTEESLKALWIKVMTRTLARHPIIVIVDGFDKMERHCQEAFLGNLADLRKWPQAAQKLRFLFISNEYPDLQSDAKKYGFSRYSIKTEDTDADITTAVGPRLEVLEKIHKYPPEFREKIGKAVPKAANGNYLRADLMLGSLKRTRYEEDNLHELLDSPSNNTFELYDHLFGRMWAREGNRRSVKEILSWVVFQREGLNPAELSISRALGLAREDVGGSNISYEKMCQFLDENTELWVNRFCGHLVKLENGRFEVVHPSLKKYLTTKPDRLLDLELHYHVESYMDAAESHARLGNLCATYLAMPVFAGSVRSESKTWFAWQEGVKERMKKYKFLRYAALHWSEHLKLSRDLATSGSTIREGKADRERRQLLENELLGNAESWIEVGCYFHDWHMHDYPKLCSINEKIKHEFSPPTQATIDISTEKGRRTSALEVKPPSLPTISIKKEVIEVIKVQQIVSHSRTNPEPTPPEHWLVQKAAGLARGVVGVLRLDQPPHAQSA